MNQYSFVLQFSNIVAISFIIFPLNVVLQFIDVWLNEWKTINLVAKLDEVNTTFLQFRSYEHYDCWEKPYFQFLSLFIGIIE